MKKIFRARLRRANSTFYYYFKLYFLFVPDLSRTNSNSTFELEKSDVFVRVRQWKNVELEIRLFQLFNSFLGWKILSKMTKYNFKIGKNCPNFRARLRRAEFFTFFPSSKNMRFCSVQLSFVQLRIMIFLSKTQIIPKIA